MRKRRTYEEEAQRRRLAWKVFKWIRKNDPDLSVKIHQDLYVVVKDILVKYHLDMATDEKVTYEETLSALYMLADVENDKRSDDFNLTNDIISIFLKK
ncbi:MAG: hypothetical protein IJX51_01625 [Clostridia bacterium]|nr:hypothetical protein [Clostridia bacterium]